MSLVLDCPAGHRLKIPNRHAGHRIRCPVCDASLLVPGTPTPIVATDTSAKRPPDSTRTAAEASLHVPTHNTSESLLPSGGLPDVDVRSQVVRDKGAQPEQPDVVEPAIEETPDGLFVDNASEPEQSGPIPTLEVSPEDPARDDDTRTPFDFMVDQPNPEQLVAIDLGIDLNGGAREGEPNSRLIGGPTSFEQSQAATALVLGIAAIMVACFCAVPSVVDHLAHWQGETVRPADGWTYLVLLGALIQAASAVYAIRLPHWSTSWVATITSTGVAGVYAASLALTMFASRDHAIVRSLGLLDEAFYRTAQAWCLLVVCISLILAYAYGRFSLRWCQLERALQQSRG